MREAFEAARLAVVLAELYNETKDHAMRHAIAGRHDLATRFMRLSYTIGRALDATVTDRTFTNR